MPTVAILATVHAVVALQAEINVAPTTIPEPAVAPHVIIVAAIATTTIAAIAAHIPNFFQLK